MEHDKYDVVMVSVDLEESVMFSNFYLSEYSNNKIKLMYGYTNLDNVKFALGFQYNSDITQLLDSQFRVHSDDESLIFMYPFSYYRDMLLYMIAIRGMTIDNHKKLFRIINVASSNKESEQWVFKEYANLNR